MSAAPPPDPLVPIFNPLYWESPTIDTGFLNANYLRFPFAQGTENLQTTNVVGTLTVSGVSTFNSTTKVLGSQFYIRDNDAVPTANMTFNPTGNNPSFSIASTNTGLTIGADTTCNIQLNGTAKTLNIATTQSNTILNVGTGARTTAVIHHYSDCDNAVAGANVHLNNGISNLSTTAIHNGSNSVGTVNIATGSGSTTLLNIGNETTTDTTTNLYGNTSITKAKTNTLQPITNTASVFLFSSLTTGGMSFGTGQTTGQFDMCNRFDRTGAVNIGNGSQQTSIITIGNETTGNTTTNLNGNTVITKPQINTLVSTGVGSAMSLYDTASTTGNFTMLGGQTSGTITIGGSTSRTGTISIGNATAGNILIGSGMLTTNTNNISIGTAGFGKLGLKSLNVYLNETGSGAINFGNSSTSAITHYKPITPSYTSVYSASTGTGTGKVGEIIKVGPTAIFLNAGVPTTVATLTNIPAGVWNLQGQAGTAANYAGYNIIAFSTVNNALQFQGASNIATYGYDLNLNISWVFTLTAATTYYLVAQTAVAGTWSNVYFQCVRIA